MQQRIPLCLDRALALAGSNGSNGLGKTPKKTCGLEPLAEVEGALLVVEVLHAPHPELLGSLLVVGGEHFCT